MTAPSAACCCRLTAARRSRSSLTAVPLTPGTLCQAVAAARVAWTPSSHCPRATLPPNNPAYPPGHNCPNPAGPANTPSNMPAANT